MAFAIYCFVRKKGQTTKSNKPFPLSAPRLAMKKNIVSAFVALLVTFTAAISFAGTELYPSDFSIGTGAVNDSNGWKDSDRFFELFNDYFSAQLGSEESFYLSSQDLVNSRGIADCSSWDVHSGSLVGAFKVAALGHKLSLYDQNGVEVAQLANYASNAQTGGTSMADLQSGIIEEAIGVTLKLSAFYGNEMIYQWSSDYLENNDYSGDNFVHMIAIDVTDLYNAKALANGKETVNTAFMVGFEDMTNDPLHMADWDYQDFVAILTNVTPAGYFSSEAGPSATPEPATLAIFGAALAGLAFFRVRKDAVTK